MPEDATAWAKTESDRGRLQSDSVTDQSREPGARDATIDAGAGPAIAGAGGVGTAVSPGPSEAMISLARVHDPQNALARAVAVVRTPDVSVSSVPNALRCLGEQLLGQGHLRVIPATADGLNQLDAGGHLLHLEIHEGLPIG